MRSAVIANIFGLDQIGEPEQYPEIQSKYGDKILIGTIMESLVLNRSKYFYNVVDKTLLTLNPL